MKSSDLKSLIAARHGAGHKRTIFIEGSPGVGKTQVVAQTAQELDIGFIAVHAPTLMPEDIALPIPNAQRTGIDFLTASILPFEHRGDDCEDQGVLLIDELPQGDTATQKALANLIQERTVHGHAIKEGWTIVATGNRQQDRAGANRILSHLSDRLTTVELEPNLDDWAAWFMQQDYFRPEGLAFLRFRPGLLSQFDPNQPHNPTPRSWAEGVFSTIGTVPVHLEYECFKGDVGEGPAAEFAGFLKVFRDLPDINQIINNPMNAAIPKDGATCYALAGALSARATKENFENIVKYSGRLAAEYQFILIRDAIRRDKTLCATRAFVKWSTNEGANILMK